jgi:DNA invertase Pin-like site-specific DNA recombinase
MRAISYLRFSTPEQKLGNSAERQLNAAREYCLRNGLLLDEEMSIADEGLSGYKGDNLKKGADLFDFLNQVEAGKIPAGTALIIENLDRLSRQGIDATTDLLKKLTRAGIDVHVIALNRVLKAGFNNNLIDYVIIGVQADLANQESAKKAERVRSARLAEKAKARATGIAVFRVPSWIRVERGAKPAVIPERAATVRRIFELASFGLGCKKIVRSLETENRKPFTSRKGKQGQKWTPEFITVTLGNRAVLGEYQPHRLLDGKRLPEGEPIADFYPPVVERSLFETAREQVAAKTRTVRRDGRAGYAGGTSKVHSLFNPLVYDADNEATMVYHRRNGGFPYLVTSWQSGKKSHTLRYDKFEAAFLGFLSDLDWRSLATEAESPEVKATRAELETVLSEIEKCAGRLAGLRALVEEGSFSASLFAAIDAEEAKLAACTGRRESLASGLAMARSRATALESPEDLLALIRSGDPELRLKLKAEIRKRISRIEISFGLDGFQAVADVKFINGVVRGIIFDGERVLLLRIEGTL